ncbi:unnamed protein product [Bursaphelenchus okinawaensis]|uniref:G-protein coupled receptors family 1 profile domain-containing protein n=1 Tax=Bursaphelenchus okinawaensis TaxID=465554 RepID=A0A811LAJ5_9BILA|nr:unnamed protein product [Bursaphelenchus okinawaensis]CAG9119735.1 unnamed protein product [Bursaphelenchus okinawaensis]
MADPDVEETRPDGFRDCLPLSDMIRAQGIDDLTSRLTVQALFGLVYLVLFVLGLVGNGGVFLAVLQNKRLRSARNIFLLNLILTDILLCLTGIPVTPWYALSKEWVFGSLMCRLMPLSNSCSVFVTSWSLTAIAIDKFMHIIDPTREQFSMKLAGMVTVLIWAISTCANIPYLISSQLVDGSHFVPVNTTPFCGHFCEETNWKGEYRLFYGTTVMVFQFVIPLSIIMYCYSRIFAKVHKDMIIQNVQFCQSLTNSQRVDAEKRKKRVNYILIAMVATFILCWFPITIVNLVKDFQVEPAFMTAQPYLWPLIAHSVAMSIVVWNPLLFFWLTRKQKRSHLGGILHTSEIITSLTSRMHSLRSTAGDSVRFGSTRIRRRTPSEKGCSRNNSVQSRPLIVSQTDNGATPTALLTKASSMENNML